MFHRLASARADETAPAPANETTNAPAETPAKTTPTTNRGFTLQTLIITAVLALTAAAAATVIVALTTNSSDDLAASAPDTTAPRCNSVEIYDPAVAARNELGVHEGTNFRGSAIGCIPVCVLTALPNPTDPKLTAAILGFSRASPGPQPLGQMTLSEIADFIPHHLRPAALFYPAAVIQVPFVLAGGEVETGLALPHSVPAHIVLPMNPPELFEAARRADSSPPSGVTTGLIPVDPRIARIAVAPNQNECLAYDSSGEPILP